MSLIFFTTKFFQYNFYVPEKQYTVKNLEYRNLHESITPFEIQILQHGVALFINSNSRMEFYVHNYFGALVSKINTSTFFPCIFSWKSKHNKERGMKHENQGLKLKANWKWKQKLEMKINVRKCRKKLHVRIEMKIISGNENHKWKWKWKQFGIEIKREITIEWTS